MKLRDDNREDFSKRLSRSYGVDHALLPCLKIMNFKNWVEPWLAAGLLSFGLELFLRYSAYQHLKILSIFIAASGVGLLGGTPWQSYKTAGKLFALVAFSGSSISMARRFPGLLKEPQPHELLELLGFGGKVFILSAIAVSAVGLLRWFVVNSLVRR